MTFGGTANPSQWSDISEVTTDLSNDLVRDPAWDPDLFQSPHQHLLKDSIMYEDDSVPLAQALELAVELPADDNPKADCYIDYIFNAFLETDVECGSRIIPFILHLFGRSLQEDKSLQCDDILSIKKLLAKATPAECQTILGWIIDTCRLLIQLPENKFLAWTHAIDEILAKKGVKHSDIKCLIGHLNHAGFIIPISCHFLGRLRHALYAAVHCPVTLKPDQRADLLLWKGFLLKAHSGISLNLLTYHLPTHIGRSDACEHGIGGFSVTTGVAWHWEIPLHLHWQATLNSLEFLVAYVQLCMDIEVGKAPPGSCFLSQTDSTSTAGWLRKSNFDDAEPLHLELARATATMIMSHESCLYSQWFAGKENDVADSLSHDHHLSDAALLALLLSSVPEQVPKDFRLCPILPDIDSKITTWLLSLLPLTQSPMAPHQSKLATGHTGTTTLSPLNWMMIHSSLPSPGVRSTVSLQVSDPLSELMTSKTSLHQKVLHQYLQQSAPPSMLWLRPTRLTTFQAQYMMPTENSPSFYSKS
jgi:hypothetical protein